MMGFANCRGFGGGFMGSGFWFYGIIILLVALVVLYLLNNNRSHSKTSAMEILDQEYAKGNVSDDDYRKRKENLLK